MWARWWARRAWFDVLMLTGSAAGAAWLLCTHLTDMQTSAAALLAVLAAVAALHLLLRHRRP